MEYMTAAQLEEEKRNLITREIERFRGAYEAPAESTPNASSDRQETHDRSSVDRNSIDRRISADRQSRRRDNSSARRDVDSNHSDRLRDRDREREHFDLEKSLPRRDYRDPDRDRRDYRDIDKDRRDRERERERGYFDRRDRSREPSIPFNNDVTPNHRISGSSLHHYRSSSSASHHPRPDSRDRVYPSSSSHRDYRDLRDTRDYSSRDGRDASYYKDQSPYDIEEESERRRLERKQREKEMSYQHRLGEWQRRERYKKELYEAQQERDREKRMLEEQESRRLKIFLEDYKDDRDDVRFYKGSALAQRLAERRKEIQKDEFEMQRERAELEKLTRNVDMVEKTTNNHSSDDAKHLTLNPNNGNSTGNPDSGSSNFVNNDKISQNSSVNDYGNNNNYSNTASTSTATPNNAAGNSSATAGMSSNSAVNQASLKQQMNDKKSRIKKQIEELINSIPTTRDELFNYQFDWSYLDETLMNHRIRPWVTKKVTEYIGEADATFIEFICARLQAHNDGPSILREVAAVLDDEAQEFVVKMWRLLIYEIEAKKIGDQQDLNSDKFIFYCEFSCSCCSKFNLTVTYG